MVLLKDTLSALLDTGAYLPVWVDEETILTEDLGAALIRKNIPFTGFGGTALVPFNMILSATMFRNLNVLCNSDSQEIKESNGKLHSMCQSANSKDHPIYYDYKN